jgi:hypothetical protein
MGDVQKIGVSDTRATESARAPAAEAGETYRRAFFYRALRFPVRSAAILSPESSAPFPFAVGRLRRDLVQSLRKFPAELRELLAGFLRDKCDAAVMFARHVEGPVGRDSNPAGLEIVETLDEIQKPVIHFFSFHFF